MIALTDEAQAVRRVYAYDDWGNDAGTGGTLSAPNADRARWKGALWMGPELDLYYMRNRWYEPGTGRFLSEDPIGLQGGINQVIFAGGDPVTLRDPDGTEQECITVTVEVDGQLPEITVICPKAGGVPQEPTVPLTFPDPPCPECNTPRNPTQGGRIDGGDRRTSPEQGPSCTEKALQTATSVGLDLAGAGLIKRSKTLFDGGVRWFTLAGKLPPGRGTVRRGLGAAQFAQSRHVAAQAQTVGSVGTVFDAVTLGDLRDAAVFGLGFIPTYGAIVSGVAGAVDTFTCFTGGDE